MKAIPLGAHNMGGGFGTTRDLIDLVPSTSIKFAQVDLDWGNSAENMQLLNSAHAKKMTILMRRIESRGPDLDLPLEQIEAETARYFDGNGYGADSFVALSQRFPQAAIWEGVNEPGISNPDQMVKHAAYSVAFANLMRTRCNKLAALGSWSVGTPDIALWKYWVPALEVVKAGWAVLARHSYGPFAAGEGIWFALRHRADNAEFTRLGYPDLPVYITESGRETAELGSMKGAYREVYGYGVDAIFRYWGEYLKPLTEEFLKDHYVKGVHLYTVGGGGGWKLFDVSGDSLAAAINSNPPDFPPDPPVPPVDDCTHQVVGCKTLNVRAHPWSGEVVPPVRGILSLGQRVRVWGIYKTSTMAFGWAALDSSSSSWVSVRYLKSL